ncbi:transcription antitermination factor NusB [Streptococcus sp. CSL10205-OR2]|uniref:transcription antitermination factor NusB n=1 Tax=Streptococcus sp. CSL10205-OR2 TaxID=2980558 RepID=UPI0021DA24A4|nr:transcription antitermination factor NusB [Streptococcus sp. CSL10205-OR2]MCU9533973.1 transcription antitermination factor NusB [Streptococcus sp. CSL10205-OR2]
MTNSIKDSRRDLRERAFQALFSLEYGDNIDDAISFTYTYDKEQETDDGQQEIPSYLISLVKGVVDKQSQLDQMIEEKLKTGWTLSRLTKTDKIILRLGLYEIRFFEDTPDRVAINEAIELAKKYSDVTSSKFINGLLNQFMTDDK